MFRALFKKQLMEINSWLLLDRRSGGKRSAAGIALTALLCAASFAGVGGMFLYIGGMLCAPLAAVGFGWLYFSVMGTASAILGVFGSVFTTYATLYRARDNDLLLSLPIPPAYILAVRLFGVWLWGLIYESLVMIPVLIVWWRTVSFGAAELLSGALLIFTLSLLILSLSCIVGWVIARIGVRLKNRNIVTVVVSLVFLALYFYLYSRAYSLLRDIVANAEAVGGRIRGAAYPLYLMGRTGEGDVPSALIFTLMTAALLAAVCVIMSRSFLRLATSSGSGRKARYREKKVRVRSADAALFFREAGRFVSSPVWMLNCALATVLLPAVGVFALVRADWLRAVAGQLGAFISPDVLPLAVCAGLCMAASMNNITAPSVSLEGQGLWLIRSLPVSPWQVLRAKLRLHLAVTEPPAVFCAVCLSAVLRLSAAEAAAMLAVAMLFVLFGASLGLAVNLRMPKLGWSSEVVPVKQSMGVMLTGLVQWLCVGVPGALWYVLRDTVPATLYLAGCAVLLAALSGALLLWLRRRGARIFADLALPG